MKNAPKISWQNRVLIALTVVSLFALYRSMSAVADIDTLRTQLAQACQQASARTDRTVDYYNEGSTQYLKFAAGWRAHGYGDIASDWEGLADRDARRSIQIANAPPPPGCALHDYATPVPIEYLPLKTAPIDHAKAHK